MVEKSNRISYAEGTPREIGLSAGRRLGKKLARNIAYYIRNRPLRLDALDRTKTQAAGMSFFRSLPARFQEEIEGLAEGAELPLQQVTEWFTVDPSVQDWCSGFASSIDGHFWVGRNNDFRAPAVWGYVSVKNIQGRIPTMNFGMEASAFTSNGINKEQLWLHSQYLPVTDKPRKNRAHFPGYVVITEALETCSNIQEVEKLLATIDRDDGMILFAIDGKTEETAIYECSCRKHYRKNPVEGRLVATNHVRSTKSSRIVGSSASRLTRLMELVGRNGWPGVNAPDDLIAVLADRGVEMRSIQFITVESVVACPGQKKQWYTLGGYPAANYGNWQEIAWPW